MQIRGGGVNRIGMVHSIRQDPQGQGRNGEEIHGHDHIAVIANESRPELAGLITGREAPETGKQS